MEKLFAKLFAPISWTIMMQILFCLPGNAFPSTEGFQIPQLDKVIHIILFGTFVGLWCFYFSKQSYPPFKLRMVFFIIFLLACFNGIAIEYIQFNFIPNRSFDTGDIIADILSSGIGYGICNVKLLT